MNAGGQYDRQNMRELQRNRMEFRVVSSDESSIASYWAQKNAPARERGKVTEIRNGL